MGNEDKRVEPRYRAHWRVTINFDEAQNRLPIHGYTGDLSLSGMAVHVETNVDFLPQATVVLSLPILPGEGRQKIIKIRVQLLYSVYSGSHSCFRIGLQYIDFTDNGRQVLQDRIERQFCVGTTSEMLKFS